MKTFHFGEYGDILTLFQQVDPKHSKVVTLVIGDPGAGKSAFATACALENMIYRGQARKIKQAINKINYLNVMNPGINLRLPPQRHLVFVTGFKVTDKCYTPNPNTSYDFDGWRVGLNDNLYSTMYFPMNSLRIFDEMQKYFPSQQDLPNGKLPIRVSTEFQKARHYGIYTIGTVQVGTDINKKLRDIASFIEIEEMRFKYTDAGTISQTIWRVKYFQSHALYTAYLDSHNDDKYATKFEFVFEGNIFRHYNSTSCEVEFDEVDNKYTAYDQSYDVANSLTPPEGYSGKGTKKEVKVKDVQ